MSIFEEKTFLKVHHLDLDGFLSELCGRAYDSAGSLGFPANGTMCEVDVRRPDRLLDEEKKKMARLWLGGGNNGAGEVPDLAVLMEVLAEQGRIQRANYLVHVWW